MIKLDEYNNIESEKPFATIKFKSLTYGSISFTLCDGEETTMEVEDGTPLKDVLEAIKIVQSRTLKF